MPDSKVILHERDCLSLEDFHVVLSSEASSATSTLIVCVVHVVRSKWKWSIVPVDNVLAIVLAIAHVAVANVTLTLNHVYA